MQPLPLKRKIFVKELATGLPYWELNQYDLKNFDFGLGTVSNSASGYKYRKNSKGILTFVLEEVVLLNSFYTKTTCVKVEIKDTQEFEKRVFDILAKYGSEPDEKSSAMLEFKLKFIDKVNKEEIEVIETPYYPKWYEPLCEYLGSFFEEYKNF